MKSQQQHGRTKALNTEEIQQRFIAFLRQRGHRVTQERLHVLSAALQRTDHFTADELYQSMLQHGWHVARATVYSTLELLTECGILVQHHFGRGARYELADKLPEHDHLICTQCGHIVEFQEKILRDIQQKISESLGFVPLKHSFQIFAVCSDPQHCSHKEHSPQK